jgi:transposase-like protein
MKTASFKALVEELEALTRSQLERLAKRVSTIRSERESTQVLAGHEPKTCRHCQGKLVRNGTQNGLQRFLCRACSTSSCATTGTPLARVSDKHQLAAYATCLKQGLTIRKAAAVLGFSTGKVFRWRHRFLENPVDHQPHKLVGLVEVDETYFKHSQKGGRGLKGPRHRGGAGHQVPVLVGRARGQSYTFDRVLPSMSLPDVAAALAPCIDPDTTVLVMDSHASFKHIDRVLKTTSCLFVPRGEASRWRASRRRETFTCNRSIRITNG